MQTTKKMTLRTKLTLMQLIPAAVLIWFAQGEIRQTSALKEQSGDVIALTELAVASSSMVHELQKERGMSAGYLGSAGQKFAAELPRQRAVTDERVANLRQFLQTFDNERFGPGFEVALNDSLASLEGLASVRAEVTDQSVSLGDAIGYYTALNGRFLNLAGQLPILTDIGSISNAGSAYYAFIQSKERAGVERAVLANVFAADAFSGDLYNRFQSLVTVQDTYAQVFLSLATDDHREFYASTLSGRAIDETERLRRVATENASTGGFGVDSVYWFDVQTQKINLLKSVEDRLSSDLMEQSLAVRSHASSAALLALLISVTGVGLSVFVGVVVTRGALRQLGADPARLEEVVSAIAADNLDMDLSTDSEPQGVYAAMCVMQKNLRERIESDHAALVETGRVQHALNNVNSAVMISDQDMNIVYVNSAADELMQDLQRDISGALPGFDAKRLRGANIDSFHRDPQRVRDVLSSLTTSHSFEAELGGRHLAGVANPVFGEDGQRIGAVVEFADRTPEVAIQEKVAEVVSSALAGDLSKRISTDGMTGFFGTLSDSVNQLVSIAERVIDDTLRVLAAMADGKLTETIDVDYEGAFGQLKRDANATVDKLTSVVTQIQQAAGAVKTGADEISQGNTNLSQRTEEQASSLEEDGVEHGADDLHGEAERRQCRTGESARHRRT